MSSNLQSTFFSELKSYNKSNFKSILATNYADDTPISNKVFSSVVTRFYIFADKHPEISQSELNALYYSLGIDLVAKYFSEYPSLSPEEYLKPFQDALITYNEELNTQEE